jgi:AcrR family transcriptional regulator
MGTTERRARHRGKLRRKILDAARELFVADGYEAVTMRTVAEVIEYSPTTIYGYFPDKHSLVATLCDEDWQHFTQSVRPVTASPDPLQRLRRFGTAYVEFALSHPHQYRFLFMTYGGLRFSFDPVPPRSAAQDAYEFLHRAVTEAVEMGSFPAQVPDDAHLIASALWLAVHGVASMHINRTDAHSGHPRDPSQTAEFLVGALLRGFTWTG